MRNMDFFDTLARYETDLWNTVDRRLASAGQISVATMQALRIVHRQPAALVNDLSAALAITVGAASKLVHRLERNGLAVRSPHPRIGGPRRSHSLPPDGPRWAARFPSPTPSWSNAWPMRTWPC